MDLAYTQVMTKSIPLSKGQFALIDDEDYERVSQFKWHAIPTKTTYYAARNKPTLFGYKHEYLHTFLMGSNSKEMVDHQDRNGLNCTRANLRPANRNENYRNRGAQSNNKAGYKGVYFNKTKKKWDAQISVGGKSMYIGRYETAEDAARAYDKRALELFGEFAYLNFPPA